MFLVLGLIGCNQTGPKPRQMECTLERSTEVWYIYHQCNAMVQNMLIVIILMIDNWCTQDCLPQDSRSKVLPMLQCTMCIPDICHFFTLTHFESWKFYTRKVRKFTTNGAQSSNFLVFLEFFYTQPKNLHSRRSWQISGMITCRYDYIQGTKESTTYLTVCRVRKPLQSVHKDVSSISIQLHGINLLYSTNVSITCLYLTNDIHQSSPTLAPQS